MSSEKYRPFCLGLNMLTLVCAQEIRNDNATSDAPMRLCGDPSGYGLGQWEKFATE